MLHTSMKFSCAVLRQQMDQTNEKPSVGVASAIRPNKQARIAVVRALGRKPTISSALPYPPPERERGDAPNKGKGVIRLRAG